MTEPGFVLDALSPEVSQTPEGGTNGSVRLVLGPHTGRSNGVVFLLGLDALPERLMMDNAVAATDYQRRCRVRALAESFVVMTEGIGFGEGTSGVDIE